jgi:hypothetical protein
MKKIIFLLLFSLLLVNFTGLTFAEKIAALTELMNPDTIVVDDQLMYIKEESTVFIYSMADYKLKKKFGKEGEGPQEFKYLQEIIPYPDKLQLNSMNKVSFYKKDGTFINEVKIINGYQFYPLKNGYVGRGTASDHGVAYITVNLFDSDFKIVKEIARMMSLGQTSGKIQMLKPKLFHQTYDNRIFVVSKEGLVIDVLDSNGSFLYSVSKKDYKKCKFTAADEEFIRQTFMRRNRDHYESIKTRLEFPGYFPEIREMLVTDGKIYVITFKRKDDRSEFLVFDVKGKFLKTFMLPLGYRDFFTTYPIAIVKGKMFQLIENDAEQWELHRVDLPE